LDTAKLFDIGSDQAVQLPQAYRMEGGEVNITKVGDAVILLPLKKKWGSLLESLEEFSDDFMAERVQPRLENRSELSRQITCFSIKHVKPLATNDKAKKNTEAEETLGG
jgi:antitoxin VapB